HAADRASDCGATLVRPPIHRHARLLPRRARLRAFLPGTVASHLPLIVRGPHLRPGLPRRRLADLGRAEARHTRNRDAVARGAADQTGKGVEIGRPETPPAPDSPAARGAVAPAKPEDARAEPVPGGRLDAAGLLRQPGRGGAGWKSVCPGSAPRVPAGLR